MGANSQIEWTDSTWNPVTGCTKVSPGCAHCYAERMARRLRGMGQANYRNGFRVTVHEHALEVPLGWKGRRVIFVNSMSDLFHEDVPEEFIGRAFDVMRRAHWHVFQVLTKRSGRLAELAGRLPWPENVWMGVTVESADYLHRIDDLRAVPVFDPEALFEPEPQSRGQTRGAAVRFLSLEPLLGPLPGLDLAGIDWVIVGGESGPGARSMAEEWALDLRDRCRRAGVAFFFKQWGGVNKKKAGRLLEGRTWDQMPDSAPAVTPSGVR